MGIKAFFHLILGIIFVLLIGLVVVIGFLVTSNRQFIKDRDIRLQSYKLADELRQSSDDLTRFARTQELGQAHSD